MSDLSCSVIMVPHVQCWLKAIGPSSKRETFPANNSYQLHSTSAGHSAHVYETRNTWVHIFEVDPSTPPCSEVVSFPTLTQMHQE